MPPRRDVLRDYQSEGVNYTLDRMRHPARGGLLVLPMGAGKTTILKCAAREAINQGLIDAAIILTPQIQIEAQFMDEDEEYIFSDPAGNSRMVSFPLATITTPRVPSGLVKPKGHSEQVLQSFLANPAGKVLNTTHSQYMHWEPLLPTALGSMSRIAVLTDEIHLSGEDQTKLFRLLKASHTRGAFLLGATATDWRTDGAGSLPLTMRPSDVFRVPYSRLILDHGFPVPEYLAMSFRHGQVHKTITLSDAVDVADLIMSLGCPPTLIHVQYGTVDGDSVLWANTLIDGLVSAGFSRDRLLNVTGKDPSIGEMLAKRLSTERALLRQSYHNRTIDGIVSCGRMLLGTDWPGCALVICIGMSTSLIRVVQQMRATRRKLHIPDYPLQWRDRCLYASFVPRIDALDPKEQQNQAAIMLENAAMLECSEVHLDFARYFDRLVVGRRYPPAVRQYVVSGPLDPVVAAAKQDYLALLTSFQSIHGRPPSMDEARAALQAAPLNPTDKMFALRELLNGEGSRSESIRKAMLKMLGKFAEVVVTLPPNTPATVLRDLFWEALLDLAKQHASTLVNVYHHPIFTGLQSRLDAATMQTLTADLIRRRNNLLALTDPEIAHICRQYFNVAGYFPSIRHGEQDIHAALPNLGYVLTAGSLDRHLQRTGFDLERLVVSIPWIELPAMVLPQYKQLFGKRRFPRIPASAWDSAGDILQARTSPQYNAAAKVFGVPGENFFGMTLAAVRGWRGLTPNSDIRVLLQ